MRVLILLPFVSVFLPFWDAFAETVATPVQLPLHEEYRQQVPVSGRVLVGMSVVAPAESSNAVLALLAPVRDEDGLICMQVMSRDGSYWSENSFNLPSGAAGVVNLEYPSRYLDDLYKEQASELAILAKAGNCDEQGMPMISGWRSAQLEKPDKLIFFVNSARTHTFVAGQYGENWNSPEPCSSIEEGRRTAYDTTCELSFSENLHAVKILRRRYDRMLRPEIIRFGAQ